MAYIRGQLLKAQLENSASDLTPVSTGLIYFNTSTTFAKVYNGSAWRSLVDDATAQTLTNKTLGVTNTVTLKDSLFTLQDDGDVTKQVVFQLSGITTGNIRTITVPDASFTMVGVALTQTLTNKTLDNTTTATFKDTLFTLQDDGDATKQVQFQLSGITTGTTRTVTMPDASYTPVGTTLTQTLTNKNLASSTNTLTGATAGSFTNTGTVTLFTASDTVVGKATTDTLTNKYLQGGTASTSNRIKLPADTTTNLSTLDASLSAGDIVYDSTLGVVKFRDGSALKTLSTTATATASSAGITTSYFPVIQSAVKAVASANYTVLDADGFEIILVTTGGANRTITLPAAANNTGRRLMIKKVDASTDNVVIDGNASETIDGALTITLSARWESATIECDGTSWFIVAYNCCDERASTQSSVASMPTTTQYTDIGASSVVLAPGVWMIRVQAVANLNTATGFTTWSIGISNTTGNSSSGLTPGTTQTDSGPPTASANSSLSCFTTNVVLTSSDSYYGKITAAYTGGTPQYRGRIQAIKLRFV